MVKLLLLLLPVGALAQPASRILDSATRQPIPFATVRLYNQQVLVQTVLADSSGRFQVQDTSITRLGISAAGYRPASFPATQTEYLLQPLVTTLGEVKVTALRPVITTRPDGFVYDATQDVQIAGETTVDLLRKLPGVQVDPDGIPSMRGSTRIKVFIDGKPSEAYASTITDALRLVPAENIARIEIITQPSARYEGEGVDGVLQIYTRRPLTDGSSGTVSGYYQNRNRQLTATIALRRKQWIISADAGYNGWNNISWTTLTRTAATADMLVQQQTYANRGTNLSGSIGIAWLADSLTTLSIGYRYGQSWDQIDNDIVYTLPGHSFSRHIDNPYRRVIYPLSWSYTRKSKNKKGEFSFLGNHFNQQIESDYDLYQDGYTEANFNTTYNRELALESNYTYGGFEAGGKAAFRRYRSTSVFVPDAGRSQDFFFPRDIYGVYVSQSFNLEKYKLRLGARYEHTVLSLVFPTLRVRVPDYKNFLPNLLVSRSFRAHTISAAYSRKIFRPYLMSLSPVVNYIDSLNISYGNPYLDPAVSNNYDLTYSLLGKKWLVSANFFWYQTLRSIESVALLKPGGIVERTYGNIASNSMTGLALQLGYRVPALTANVNNNIRYVDYGSRSGWVNNFTMNATWKITPVFSASGYLLLNGTRTNLQGRNTGTRYYNFAVQRSFAKGKYALSARIDNLFMPYQVITDVTQPGDFTVATATKQVRRFFRLGFNYKFGKKEIRVPPARTVSGEN